MGSLVGDLQAYNIGFAHETGIVLQEEATTVVFEKRVAGTNGLVALLTVSQFRMQDVTAKGYTLPPDVELELSIAEDQLTLSQIAGATSLRHGNRRYRMIRNAPLPPTAEVRYWRFWLAFQEMV